MNYEKIYYDLILRAKLRSRPLEYTERHHIEPKCITNNNEPWNLVVLTAREHFIAHRLLVKFIKTHKVQMLNALYAMSMVKNTKRKLTSREVAVCRQAKSDAQRNRIVTEATRKKLSEAHKDKTILESTKSIMSISAKQRVANNKDKHREVSIKGNIARQNLSEEEKSIIYKKVSESQVGNKSNEVFYSKLRELTDIEFELYLVEKRYSDKYEKYVRTLRNNLIQTSTTIPSGSTPK